MDGLQDNLRGPAPRTLTARLLYGALVLATAVVLVGHPGFSQLRAHPGALCVLIALSLCGYGVNYELLARVGRVFDMSAAIALVALAVAGPLGVVAVSVAPDLIHVGRRRRDFANLGLVANLVSWAAAAIVGGAVVGAVHATGRPEHAAMFLAAGVAMIAANYLFARLLLAVVRDRQSVLGLLRRELLGALPLELLVVGVGVSCVLLYPSVGIPVFAALTALVYIPQLAAAQLLRAPSVAALSLESAAAVYRDALADELGLTRSDRRLVHLVDALVQRRSLPEAPPNPLTAIQDAMLVTICTARAPTQRHFSATPTSQVVLVARDWAKLTARCTPALNHHEALAELRRTGLAQDAPLAVAAAARIVAREDAFTEHVAGVPRLHRAPLPRTLRQGLLPVALGRLAA